MRRSKFNESQIVGILKNAGASVPGAAAHISAEAFSGRPVSF